MDAIMTRPEVVVLVIVLVVESVKALILGTATSYQRGSLGKFINPEDASWLNGEMLSSDAPGPGRLFRAHRNSLENLLPFSLLALTYLLVGGNSSVGIFYFIIFSLSRLAHTYAYLTSKPMLRRNTYTSAWLVQIVLAMHVSSVVIGGYVDGI